MLTRFPFPTRKLAVLHQPDRLGGRPCKHVLAVEQFGNACRGPACQYWRLRIGVDLHPELVGSAHAVPLSDQGTVFRSGARHVETQPAVPGAQLESAAAPLDLFPLLRLVAAILCLHHQFAQGRRLVAHLQTLAAVQGAQSVEAAAPALESSELSVGVLAGPLMSRIAAQGGLEVDVQAHLRMQRHEARHETGRRPRRSSEPFPGSAKCCQFSPPSGSSPIPGKVDAPGAISLLQRRRSPRCAVKITSANAGKPL